ncbi:MAG: pantoate--beta-alanine ligase [Ferruginibacter sp.]
MIIAKAIKDTRFYLNKWKNKGLSTGFAPTMGALHAGHISLIQTCKKENDTCISSIFVNPTQFNNPADFEKYPITIEKDIDMLEAAGCDLLFLPTVNEIYPPGYKAEHYELGYLESILDGKYRPGHFQGVCQVVDKLLSAIQPHKLYLGQKDYQQCMVIKKLIELKGYKTSICINPTIREKDGLAMSSRNMRLNQTERQQALAISRILYHIKENMVPGSLGLLKQQMTARLEAEGFKVDYVEIADAGNLELLDHWNGHTKTVALVAAFLNEVRLIDNMVLN